VSERLEHELRTLAEGGQAASLHTVADRSYVIYAHVPVGAQAGGLPDQTDVIVPVPFRIRPASLMARVCLRDLLCCRG